MTTNLKEKTASAITWTTIDRFGYQLLTFVIGIILARNFLSPDDYGLMGMIAVFTALTNILLDSGFSSALIRKTSVSQTDLSTIFHFNLAMSICCYLIMFLCAPLIAGFFHYPILTTVCRINSLAFILNAFTFTQSVTFSRATNFRPITLSNLAGAIISGIIAIIMAYHGFGVYALVYQNLIMMLVRGCCLWFFSRWRPSFIFDFKVIKELWGYSSKLLFTGVLNSIFNYISPVLIGVYYPAKDVGLYTQGNKMSELSSITVSSALQSATFPVLAQIKEESDRLKQAYRKIIRVTSFISFPVMFGLSAVAIPFINVLLKEQWHDSAIYMQILCIGAAFLALVAMNVNILNVKGRSNLTLIFEVTRKILILISIFLTFRYGIKFLAMGISLVGIISFFISGLLMRKEVNYKISEQLKDIFPYFSLACVMALGIYSLSFLIDNELILLLVQFSGGTVFYLGAVYLLGSKVFREILILIKGNLR
ncbi:MAG: lipopolysaccharide biosynthesis protein [Candidatus Azobacteroides sp.]|nr:lipopolysaccharide biosynthesis protein [Candidatus Azobacteroides sp.]